MEILNIFSMIKGIIGGAIALIGGIFIYKKAEETNELKEKIQKEEIKKDNYQTELVNEKVKNEVLKDTIKYKNEVAHIDNKKNNADKKEITKINNDINKIGSNDEIKEFV